MQKLNLIDITILVLLIYGILTGAEQKIPYLFVMVLVMSLFRNSHLALAKE